ncbi:hypothetical protein JTB14_022120 [Gonioctena quinquepunctata]|nr:hypothetical protein JTB14_022120 [Gonioctena quinquepunctata]
MEASGLSQNDDSKPAITAANLSDAFNQQDSPGSSGIHFNFDKYGTLREEPLELSTIMEESYEELEAKTFQETKRRLMKTRPRPKRTWQTPERRDSEYLSRLHRRPSVPSIHAVQEMLVNKAPNISRNAVVVRSWLHAEINRIRKLDIAIIKSNNLNNYFLCTFISRFCC